MTYLISRYEIHRTYGGPEEGGWWWDRMVFAEVIATCGTERKAELASQLMNEAERAREEADAGGHKPAGRFSVNGGPDTRYLVETSEKEHENPDDGFYC